MTNINPHALAGVLAAPGWGWTALNSSGRTFGARRSPYCDEPVRLELQARAIRADFSKHVFNKEDGGGGYTGSLAVPCRKCKKCLLYRKMHWIERMKFEVDNHERTVFVTLTLHPKARLQLNVEAIVRSGSQSPTYQDRVGVIGQWLTDYLKRLRAKIAPARLRFIAVTEQHADGTPHIHLLVHGAHAHLKAKYFRCWGLGFVQTKICDSETARYLAKYLTKDAKRVRASLRYGVSAPVEQIDLPLEGGNGRMSIASNADKSDTTRAKEIAPHKQTLLKTDITDANVRSDESVLAASVWNGDIDSASAQQIAKAIAALTRAPKLAKAPAGGSPTSIPEPGAATEHTSDVPVSDSPTHPPWCDPGSDAEVGAALFAGSAKGLGSSATRNRGRAPHRGAAERPAKQPRGKSKRGA